MEKTEIVDVEKIVEQGKAILKGEALPKITTEIKSTLETIGTEVEQVRYAEAEKLSATGQAVLKDLEEILVGGAEVTEAIPPETFLHATRAQQKAAQVTEEIGKEVKKEEAEEIVMNLGSLLRILFTSSEFRDALMDWSNWMRDVLITSAVQAKEKAVETEIGQVPTELVSEPVQKISNEQVDKMIGMLEWMQEREEYQTAIWYIFNQLGKLSTILGIQEEEAEEIESSEAKRIAMDAAEEAKRVGLDTLKALENWTHKPTEPFKNHLTTVAGHLKSDSRLRTAIQLLAHFLANCLREPDFLNDRKWIREEAGGRLEDVRDVIEGEGYGNDLRSLADEARDLIKSLDREPRTAHLKESLRKLLEDLFVTESATATAGFRLKTELLNDMGVIVGNLLQRAKFLRVPDIEIHDEDLDFTAHNVILDAAELIPQQFKMTIVTENLVEKMKHQQEEQEQPVLTEEEKERVFVNLEPSEPKHLPASVLPESSSDWKTHLKFEVKGIHGHCRNVHFNVRKRSGFPQLSDEGLADLRVWGPKGMLVKVVLRPEWVREEVIEREVHSKETIGKTQECQ